MTWDAIGAIAELLGALAVIVSVLYLAVQVKQSAADVRASIVHSLHSNEVEIQSKPSTDVVLARAVEKVYTGEKLDDDERAQYTMWLYAALLNFEQVYLEYNRLGVESEYFEAQKARISGGLEPKLAKIIFERLSARFSVSFQKYARENCFEFNSERTTPTPLDS
jgi:hypothetical protein